MTALMPGRGAMDCEYIGELADFIERTNCRKGRGCIHGEPDREFIVCSYGLLAQLFLEQPIPEFEAHGNKYVVCLKRQEAPSPPKSPVTQDGPDLFAEQKGADL